MPDTRTHARDLAFTPGTELVFGPQAARRRQVSDTIARISRGWGFTDIILPSFDDRRTFDGVDAPDSDLYRFMDHEGRWLTLRADFTLIAAKALAIELRREPRMIRASYEGRVFRFQSSGHGARVEQTQRGLEWVNARGVVFDAAALCIASECISELGLKDATLVVGHAGFIAAVLGERGKSDRALLEAIDHKNAARIQELAHRRGIEKARADLLTELPSLCGGPEVIARARAKATSVEAKAALDELEALAKLLRESGAGFTPLFDLGEVRQFSYYSGMMFKVYHPQVGGDLGGGGRYDKLFDRYGLDVPAVGFGFDLARVTDALPRNENGGENAVTTVNARNGAIALREALEARAKGQSVALAEGKR
jgi:ATP phosphoribosyltransferase regulatory subunit